MVKPVNLNKFKKAKAKAEGKLRADQNAAFHGLTKSEKDRAKAETTRQTRVIDLSKRDT